MSRKNMNRFAAFLAEDDSAPSSPATPAPAPSAAVALDSIPSVDISGAAILVIARPPTPPIPTQPPTPVPELTEEEKQALEEQRKHQAYMEEHYYKPEREASKKAYEENMMAYFDSPRFWEDRLASLERQRWKYVKKPAWSASDLVSVEQLDVEMKEATDALAAFPEIDEDEYEAYEVY